PGAAVPAAPYRDDDVHRPVHWRPAAPAWQQAGPADAVGRDAGIRLRTGARAPTGQGKQGSWQSSTFKLIVTARWSGVSWVSRGRRQEGPGQAPGSDAGSGAGVHQGSAVPAVPGAQATAARG